jgi:hypothetical protein
MRRESLVYIISRIKACDQSTISDTLVSTLQCTPSTSHHQWDPSHRHTHSSLSLLQDESPGDYDQSPIELGYRGANVAREACYWGIKCLKITSNHPLALLFALWTTMPQWQTRPDTLFAPLGSGLKLSYLLRRFWIQALWMRPGV